MSNKQFSIFGLILFSILAFSCKSNSDDETNVIPSHFEVTNNGIKDPIRDYYAYVSKDSNVTISAFTDKLPIEGKEDEIENYYTKQTLKLELNEFREGQFKLDGIEARLQVDTSLFIYSPIPTKISSFITNKDSLNTAKSFVYIKKIRSGYDLISGDFNLVRITSSAPGDTAVKFTIKGDFLNLPYTHNN